MQGHASCGDQGIRYGGVLYDTGTRRQEGFQSFFALYPDGLLHACEQELLAFGGAWLATWPEECAAVISLCDDPDAPLPGTFSLLFRLFNSGSALGSVLADTLVSSHTLDDLVAQLVTANAASIARYLGGIDSWRITASRRDVAAHNFKSRQVEFVVGQALEQLPGRDKLTAEVSLIHYKKELRVWVGGRIMALGFTATLGATPSLAVGKGAVLSRADDAVSVGVAWLGFSHALALPGPVLRRASLAGLTEKEARRRSGHLTSPRSGASPDLSQVAPGGGAGSRRGSVLRVLDPMCGVGTYLFGAALVADRLGVSLEVKGRDVSSDSVDMARNNARVHLEARTRQVRDQDRACSFDFAVCDCVEEAPCLDGWAQLVMVDPPWGQRHSSWNQVRQAMPTWTRRWAEALCEGGVLIVVTIRTKSFELETVPLLRTLGLALREAARFNNKGYYMCKYYLFVKDVPQEERRSLQVEECKKAGLRHARKEAQRAIRLRPALVPGDPVTAVVAVPSAKAKAVKDELKRQGWLLILKVPARPQDPDASPPGEAEAAERQHSITLDAAHPAVGGGHGGREVSKGGGGAGERKGGAGEGNARMLILLPLRPDVDAAEAQAFLDQCLPESGAFVEAPCQPLFVPKPKNPAVGWWW
jgi:SAM-dependent methyltransferase